MHLSLEQPRALIIDDESLQRNTLSIICSEMGYATILANSSMEALKAIDEMPFTLILSELKMKDVDGLQLVKELAKRGVTSKLIFVSSLPQSILYAAQELGTEFGLNVKGTVQKPFTAEEVVRLLEEVASTPPHMDQPVSRDPAQIQGGFSTETILRGIQDGAVIPYYQPQICSKNKTLAGLECLARWRTSTGKILGPNYFIPTAEEHGLIRALTTVIVHQVFADRAYWQKQLGIVLPVSINISTDNLKDSDFPDNMVKLASEYNIEPSTVVLEITETKVMEEARQCLEVMSRLRLKGFGLSIDDFGTGYASLKQLQYIPFTELKLDQSYVAAAINHHPSRTVLESGIQLAKNLSLTCVAEGVETPEQAALLHSLGCYIHQGYLYARPMSSKDIVPWASEYMANDVLANKAIMASRSGQQTVPATQ